MPVVANVESLYVVVVGAILVVVIATRFVVGVFVVVADSVRQVPVTAYVTQKKVAAWTRIKELSRARVDNAVQFLSDPFCFPHKQASFDQPRCLTR